CLPCCHSHTATTSATIAITRATRAMATGNLLLPLLPLPPSAPPRAVRPPLADRAGLLLPAVTPALPPGFLSLSTGDRAGTASLFPGFASGVAVGWSSVLLPLAPAVCCAAFDGCSVAGVASFAAFLSSADAPASLPAFVAGPSCAPDRSLSVLRGASSA